jgi:hypothetical protein
MKTQVQTSRNLNHFSDHHIDLRTEALFLDAPETRVAYHQGWRVGPVRMWVNALKSVDGVLTPLLTVGNLTLNEDEARLFTHQACEVRAALLGLRELSA